MELNELGTKVHISELLSMQLSTISNCQPLSNYVAESINSNWLLDVSGMHPFINCVQFLLINSATYVYAHAHANHGPMHSVCNILLCIKELYYTKSIVCVL